MVKPNTDSLQEYEEWEELGDDNGEVINFEVGTTETGIFLRRVTVPIPEEKRDPARPDNDTADLLVFAYPHNTDTRWSVWVGYQLDRIPWEDGETYKVGCVGERKAAQGKVKIWSVKRRHVKKEEAF